MTVVINELMLELNIPYQNEKVLSNLIRLLNWWASACYLRTNLDELRGLVENDKNLTQNKKYTIMTAVLNDWKDSSWQQK